MSYTSRKESLCALMNITLLLVCRSLRTLSFSSRCILAPLLPVIEGEFPISHIRAGGLFLFLTAGMTVSYRRQEKIGYLWG